MCDYGSFLAPANDILLSFLEEDGGWVDGNGCCDQHSDLYVYCFARIAGFGFGFGEGFAKRGIKSRRRCRPVEWSVGGF